LENRAQVEAQGRAVMSILVWAIIGIVVGGSAFIVLLCQGGSRIDTARDKEE
jgi:uncharacterized membrane protein